MKRATLHKSHSFSLSIYYTILLFANLATDNKKKTDMINKIQQS